MKTILKLSTLLFILISLNSVNAQSKENNYDNFLNETIKEIKASYIFPDVANKTADAIAEHQASGKYNGLNKKNFAKTLSKDLVEASGDKHFNVMHAPTYDSSSTNEKKANTFSLTDKRTNYGFDEVKRLKGNIGYIKASVFADTKPSEEALASAMNFISNTSALIIDVRHHIGGSGETVMMFLGYFFPEKTLVSKAYFRHDNSSIESWTDEKVLGKKYLNKPVYILVGGRTISASEAFAYNLQQYDLATIVGTKTYGAANPVGGVTVDDFNLFIPIGNETNTITKTNWEGVGLQPDVKSESALETSQILALKNFLKNNPKGSDLSEKEIKTRIQELKNSKK